MRTLTFGSDEAAKAVAARINAIHDRVHGSIPQGAGATPSAYSAHDPALLAWVHVTLVDSTLRVYERLVDQLRPDDRDRYCAEAGTVARWFGVPDLLIPGSHAALQAAVSTMVASGELRSSGEAQMLAREVLHPPLAWLGGPAAGFVRRLTVSELPPEIRALYNLDWTDRDERALTRAVPLVRTLRSGAPLALSHWPEARTRGAAQRQG